MKKILALLLAVIMVFGLEGLPYFYNSYWVNPAEHMN